MYCRGVAIHAAVLLKPCRSHNSHNNSTTALPGMQTWKHTARCCGRWQVMRYLLDTATDSWAAHGQTGTNRECGQHMHAERQ